MRMQGKRVHIMRSIIAHMGLLGDISSKQLDIISSTHLSYSAHDILRGINWIDRPSYSELNTRECRSFPDAETSYRKHDEWR